MPIIQERGMFMSGRKFDLNSELDEMHLEVLNLFPDDFLTMEDIAGTRAAFTGPPAELSDKVQVEDVMIRGLGDDPDLRVKLYRPEELPEDSPALLWMHPGGMTLLSADSEDEANAARALNHMCLVISVDYRLAPENPYPAAPDDCYAALLWTADNASVLGIDPMRIVVGGASAGAGLAASTALRARDESGPEILFQLLTYPMLDHRNETPSSYGVVDEFRVWNRQANLISWNAYVGALDEVPTYASPSLESNLTNLPPAFISVGSLDNFVDECIDYAQRLMQAGVPTDLRVYSGAFHGSVGMVAHSPISVEWAKAENDALHRAFYPNT